MFVQLLFITFTAATLRLWPHASLSLSLPQAYSQMNEMKLNKFMIFARFTHVFGAFSQQHSTTQFRKVRRGSEGNHWQGLRLITCIERF